VPRRFVLYRFHCINEPPCIHPTVKEHIGKAPINYSSSMETSDKGDNFLPVDT
jgi:hypothetical protein